MHKVDAVKEVETNLTKIWSNPTCQQSDSWNILDDVLSSQENVEYLGVDLEKTVYMGKKKANKAQTLRELEKLVDTYCSQL